MPDTMLSVRGLAVHRPGTRVPGKLTASSVRQEFGFKNHINKYMIINCLSLMEKKERERQRDMI